jgi:hypothetical protein
MGSWVHIDQEDLFFHFGQSRSEIDGGGRFPHSALVIDDGYRSARFFFHIGSAPRWLDF